MFGKINYRHEQSCDYYRQKKLNSFSETKELLLFMVVRNITESNNSFII